MCKVSSRPYLNHSASAATHRHANSLVLSPHLFHILSTRLTLFNNLHMYVITYLARYAFVHISVSP